MPLEKLLAESEAGLEVEHYLRGVDSMFMADPPVTLTEKQERLCRNGNAFPTDRAPGKYRAYGKDGEFLALTQSDGEVMSTIKSFFEV